MVQLPSRSCLGTQGRQSLSRTVCVYTSSTHGMCILRVVLIVCLNHVVRFLSDV